jgi:hypothetical protein
MSGNFLHQLLCVEQDLAQQSRNILDVECLNTFTKKEDLFDGVLKNYVSFDQNGEQIPPEKKELVTTVAEKLDYAKDAMIKAIDATISKEETNASGTATAPLKLDDGTDFGTLSATSLIALEKYLVRIREVYKKIPTVDPARSWTKDPTQARAIYVAPVETKFRSVEKLEVLLKAAATDKFAAQTELVKNVVQVGRYETTYSTGRLQPIEKSNLLSKIDTLIQAVKQARQQANQAQVVNVKLGDKLFTYINS